VTGIRRARAAALMLDRPRARTPREVAEHLLAIQAQNLRQGRFAIRARSKGLTAADVDRAFDDGEIVVTWLNRGTLHITTADDYPWLLALTAPRNYTSSRTRLEQLGVSAADAERGIEIMLDALAADGPLPRAAIGERIAAAGIRTKGNALTHIVIEAALYGKVVMGPMQGKRQAVALTRDWLGSRPRVDRDAALGELARRYLRSRGPATDADLAYWAGVNIGDARKGMARIASELADAGDGLVDLKTRGPVPRRIPPRMLGGWDDYLLSWKDRSFAVQDEHLQQLIPGGGLFHPALTVDGVVVGSWRAPASGVALHLFDDTDPAVFEKEVEDVRRFEAAPKGV
jgi:hypothetical protein